MLLFIMFMVSSYSSFFSKFHLKLRKYKVFPVSHFICLKPFVKFKNTKVSFILYKVFILKKKLKISSKINNLKSNLIFLDTIFNANIFNLLLYCLKSKNIDKEYKFSIVKTTKVSLNLYTNLTYLQKLSFLK